MTIPRDTSSVCTLVPFVQVPVNCKGMRRLYQRNRHVGFCYDRFWRILLQKSDARDRVVWPFVRGGGFKPPALTLFTQLQLYAMHRTSAGGGRATNDASRRRF